MSCTYRLIVPAIFNPNSFEYFLDQLPVESQLPESEVQIDLGLVSSISPYGVSVLLILYQYLKRLDARVTFRFYENHPIFNRFRQWKIFDYLDPQTYQVDPGAPQPDGKGICPDIFLTLSRIRREDDIYKIIEFLREHLDLPIGEFTDLIVAVSEIAQNIIEHSGTEGFLNIGREYHSVRRRQFLHICIADAGVGMGPSLKERLAQYETQYIDGFAIYKALFEGISRHDDPGRGNGVIKTQAIIKKYRGKMVMRSGRAKLWGDVPAWQIERFLRKNLRYLPGTQVNITFPVTGALWAQPAA